jgi:hypothetical protein
MLGLCTHIYSQYLSVTMQSALTHPSNACMQVSKSVMLHAAMRLEAVDRKNPTYVCVATIKNVDSQGAITITFDGWGDAYDYQVGA